MGAEAPPYDVAVVGFGPVGAVLAGLLGRRGLRVLVLDREAGLYPLPRAAHVDHTALRTLQELGCLDELLPGMIVNPGTDCVTADRRLLFSLPSDRPAPGGLPASMYFHQPTFDAALRRTVAALPSVDVGLECELTDLAEESDAVTLRCAGAGCGSGEVRTRWVVGCDGASSRVRELVGIERSSFGFEEQWLILDLRLGDRVGELPRRAVQVCDPARPRTELPMPGDRYRLELMLMPGEDAHELLSSPAALRELLSLSFRPPDGIEIERTASYTFCGMVAKRWRAGRVFLAGDAAHLLPPFLGQGMCSGLRDAANLAWKLDHVRRGAPDALLDTYGTERRPHVGAVVGAAVELGRIICVADPEEAARRDRALLERPGTAAPPYRFSLPPLEPGPLVLAGGGGQLPQTAPDAAGRRLDELVGPRFHVIAGAAAAPAEADLHWWRETAGAHVSRAAELPDPDGSLGRRLARRPDTDVVVVRPDRYLLAAGPDLHAITAAVRPLLDGSAGGGAGVV